MKLPKFSKKAVVIGSAVGLTLGLSGAALAYFTSSGSGSGTANIGTGTPLTISDVSTPALVPNGVAEPVSYQIVDPTADGGQNLGVVSISNVVVTNAQVNSGLEACLASMFTVEPAADPVGTIAAGTTYSSATAGTSYEPTIALNDDGNNQDNCQTATVTLTLTAAAGS